MTRSIEEEGRVSFERRMLVNYDLDETKFRRLGFFFLVHHHIDIKLIALVVKCETEKLRLQRDVSYDDHTLLSLKWSRGTFKRHLRHAGERSLLEPEEFRVAEEINRARDHFVHFEVGRFQSRPYYFGKDVTSEDGYHRFLRDAMTFDANVQFPSF